MALALPSRSALCGTGMLYSFYQSIILHGAIPIVTVADDVFVLPAVEPGVGPAVQQVGDEPVAQSGPVAEDDIPTKQITFRYII